MSRTVLLVAGEASGDLHASRLARALRAADPTLRMIGIGGPEMERAGVDILFPMRRLSVVGLTEVATRLPTIVRSYRSLVRLLATQPPDLFVPVDFPGLNLRLARAAHVRGVPVLYYIAPQVWAWWPSRVRAVRRSVDRVAVIFPFEEALLRASGIDARFVGHPLVDALDEDGAPPPPIGDLGDRTLVALLPGSRKGEVRQILPALLDTAAAVAARRPGTAFAIGVAETIPQSLIDGHLARARAQLGDRLPEVDVVRGRTLSLLRQARAAIVASGTATLEAACVGCPMAIVYRVSPVTFWWARRLVRVPYVGLPNCILGRPAVPEFLQDRLVPAAVAQRIATLLDAGPDRSAMLVDLAAVREALGGPGASARAAELALSLLEGHASRVAPREPQYA